MKFNLLAWAIAFAWASPAWSQSASALSEPTQSEPENSNVSTLDTVVITGTRTERRLQEVPASISVLNEQDFERSQPQYLGDELVTVPGVFVRRRDGGSFSTVTIRGVPERHHNDTFLLMLDGVPYVSGNEETEMDVVPVDAVQRAEIVKGPMSALYGRGGVAGTLSYFSVDPFTAGSKAGLRVGSYGAIKPFATVSKRFSDTAAFTVSASADRLDGWADHTQRKAESLFAKGSWLYGDDSSVDVVYLHHRNRQELGSFLPLAADGSVIPLPRGERSFNGLANARSSRDTDSLYAILNHRLSANWRLKLTGSVNQRTYGFRGGFWTGYDAAAQTISMIGYDENGTKSTTGYLDAQLTGQIGRHRLVAGASLERMRHHPRSSYEGTPFTFYQQVIDTRTGLAINPQNFIRDQTLNAEALSRVDSLYVQDEFDLAPHWRLTLGARHDRFSRDVDYAQTPSTIWGDPSGVTPAAHAEGGGSHTSPKVALTWNLAPTTTLYASFGQGYSPALRPAWAFSGRPTSLKPEVATGYEIGAKGSALDGILGYSVALYKLNRKDLAEWVMNSAGGFQYSNVGKQRSQGLEVSTNWKLDALAKGLTGYLNYAYTDSKWINKNLVNEHTGTPYDFSGNRVPGVPKHQVAIGGAYELGGGFGIYGGLQYFGSYFIDQPNTAKSKSYAVVDVGATYRAPGKRGWEARLHIGNLTNKRYYNYVGGNDGPQYAAVGSPREVYVTLAYRF